MDDYSNLSREELIDRLRAMERQFLGDPNTVTARSMNEEKYQTLFDNMVEEVHFWQLVRDEAGAIKTWRLVDINPAAAKSWGMARDDVIGKTADEIFETATELFMPIVAKIFDENQPYSWETYFADLNQHMRMTSVPFGDYFFTTGFDVTEMKKDSAKQEKLSMMARMATEASDIGVWELEIESGHLTWNEQMLEIFGTDPSALTKTAQDWIDRLHPDEREDLVAKLQKCVETGESFSGDFRIVMPSGETRFIKARSEILKSEITGSPILIGTNIDVTSQEMLIEELKEARELSNQSNAAKSEFLANMSHELRTPMNAVLGYTQMLQLMADDRLNGKEKQYLSHILESGQHLLTLINDILDLSQIESGRLGLENEELDVLEILDQVETIIRPLSQTKQVTIDRSLVPADALRIRSDRIRVSQILLNLLSNAVKYSPEKGQIKLSARAPSSNRIRFSVTDSGGGIAPEDQIVIFNPFTRLQGNPMIATEGVGIGLAVSKKLAEQLGGTIGVDSQVGAGSTFWVEFPAASRGTDHPESVPAQSA